MGFVGVLRRNIGGLFTGGLSRRQVFLGAIGAVLAPRLSLPAGAKNTPSESSILAAFVETLVPRDTTPSARDLNVHQEIVAHAASIGNYPQLISAGTDWLDQTARLSFGTEFGSLDEARRGRVVAAAFASQLGTLPQVFATRLRADVMRLYYKHEESWSGMIDSPPQPLGYPRANLPPRLR